MLGGRRARDRFSGRQSAGLGVQLTARVSHGEGEGVAARWEREDREPDFLES